MIARVWRGWTRLDDADQYEHLLRERVIPRLRKIAGHRSAQLLRLNRELEAEFIVVNYFDSLAAVREFAGEDYTTPVFEPEARRLLVRLEPKAEHYDVRLAAGEIGEPRRD
ncbi:MAG TPA: antibiotic biosynthesis monooxygenase [Terriglobales bacterium]